jgi:hypothetical protein
VPHASFAWREGALRVAFEAPRTDQAPGARAEDAFELKIAGANGSSHGYRVTPRGLVEPASASDVRVAAETRGSIFTAELSLPFGAVGVAPPHPGENLWIELSHQPAAPGAIGVGARLGGGKAFSRLVLAGGQEGVRIAASSALGLGRLKLDLEHALGGRVELTLDRVARPLDGEEALTLRERHLLCPISGRPAGRHARPRWNWLVSLATRIAPLDVPGIVVVRAQHASSRRRARSRLADSSRPRSRQAARMPSSRIAGRGSEDRCQWPSAIRSRCAHVCLAPGDMVTPVWAPRPSLPLELA